MTTLKISGITLGSKNVVQLKTRPYNRFAQFKNISLQPGKVTKVGINTSMLVPQKFVAQKNAKDVSWSQLTPMVHSMQAWAGVGSTFPVEETWGKSLFTVTVIEGNDVFLRVEVRGEKVEGKDGAKVAQLFLARDQASTVKVDGREYELRFPSVNVGDIKEEITHRAMIVVSY